MIKRNNLILFWTISSYIIEKQKYFFELDSTFQDLFKPECFIECNILLIGESRAGKSSFINRFCNKLVSHEDANLESVTNNSTQYTFRKGKVGIKFIDTPGIIKEANNKFIKQILDEYFGKIHLIYFFIKAQSNLENCIEILKYIKFKNEKSINEGNKKIPILFIKNGEDLVINETPAFFKNLQAELNKHEIYDELYDNKFNQKSRKAENELNEEDLFNENEDIENNYDNYCEGNIIQIHIPTGKNINKIFWISKEYLIKNNKFLMDEKDNEFIQMKEYTKKLIKFYIKEKIEKNELNKEEKEEKSRLLE
jgi:GTPase Era involved in 16S rRNA processing